MQFTHRIDSLKWVQYSTKGEECLSLDRDEASKDISCSSCQKFLVRQTGKCCYNVVDSSSLFLCWSHALFAFPSATWHTKHISRHWSPDSPCGLQVPFYTTPTSPRNLLPGKGDCCFHHKAEGREKLQAESPRKRDRNSLSLIKCAIQNLVNREMKSSCWEMEREIAFWPWGNLCL